MQSSPFKLEYQCDQKWNRMPEMEGQKLCARCNMVVHDLTEKSTEEILEMISRSSSRLCGHIYLDQLQPGEPSKPFSIKVAMAGLAALFTLGAVRLSAQNAPVPTEQRIDTTSPGLSLPHDLLATRDIGPHPDEPEEYGYKYKPKRRHHRTTLFTLGNVRVYVNNRFPFLHAGRAASGFFVKMPKYKGDIAAKF